MIAVISPKGGVGKTTNTFLIGNILAQHLRLRAVALDANPDFGTLAALAPDGLRSERDLADLLANWDDVKAAAEVRTYVSRLPTGLHLLGRADGPQEARRADARPVRRDRDLPVLLLRGDPARLRHRRRRSAGAVRDRAGRPGGAGDHAGVGDLAGGARALEHLSHERITVVVNKAVGSRGVDLGQIERRFSEQRLHRSRTLPLDQRLQVMLDSGTYKLEGLSRPTRSAMKLLGLTVAEQLA